MSIGSSIRRRASAYVQKISAAQMTTRKRMMTLTAVSRPRLLMPNTARGSTMMWPGSVAAEAVGTVTGPGGVSKERPPERVADAEEHQDDERHDQRDQPDHGEDARPVVAVHS